jgi:hypothetical protein
MDRKRELDLKKAKLEQIKKEKLLKSKVTSSPSPLPNQSENETANIDAEQILIQLGITTPVLTSSNTNLSSIGGTTSPQNELNDQQHQSNNSQTKSLRKK